MKNDGFTLIELIGIVGVLGMLLLVGLPALTMTLNKNKENEFSRVKRDIELAAENYVINHLDEFDELDELDGEGKFKSVYISLNLLKENGYIPSGLVDPRTDTQFDYNLSVKIFKDRNNDNLLKYEFVP